MTDRHEATFFWPYVGPHNVQVKGSFDNWSSSIPLTRTATGFEAHVPVEWGKDVQYKYIVDGVWATAADKPTVFDSNGNVNNVYHAPLAPAKVEETRVVTTSDLPPVHTETIPAPPADAISPTLDPFPEKPVVDEPKPNTLEQVKATVIASGGTSSPISYIASGMGAAIKSATGIDPINPPQLPVDGHTHSPIRFNRKSDDLPPGPYDSPVKDAIAPATLIDVVKKPVVATVPDTVDAVKDLSAAPIVAAVTKPIVAVLPETLTASPPIDAAPIVFEEAKKEVEAVPDVLKDAQVKAAEEPPKEPEAPKPTYEPEVPKPAPEPPVVPEVPKPVEEPPKVPEIPEPPKVVEVPKPVEAPQVPEPPKPVEEPPKVAPEAPKVVEEPPKDPEDKAVDPPAPATPKGPAAPIALPPAGASFPTIPSPKKPEPTTPTKKPEPTTPTKTNGTLTSVKSRESTSKSPFGTKRSSFLGRQSSDSPSKASISSGKERKRKTSFLAKIKHIFSHDDKDKEKNGIKEKK